MDGFSGRAVSAGSGIIIVWVYPVGSTVNIRAGGGIGGLGLGKLISGRGVLPLARRPLFIIRFCGGVGRILDHHGRILPIIALIGPALSRLRICSPPGVLDEVFLPGRGGTAY